MWRAVFLVIASAHAVGCDKRVVYISTPVDGVLTVPPASNGNVAWSSDPKDGRISLQHGLARTCHRNVIGAHFAVDESAAWGITTDALWWMSADNCEKPLMVTIDPADKYTVRPAVALGDVLIASSAIKKERAIQDYRVYAISTSRSRTQILFRGEVPDSKGQLPIVDALSGELNFASTTLDGRRVWLAVGSKVCSLDVAEVRAQTDNGRLCTGRDLSSEIVDLSAGASHDPLWVATKGGALSWTPNADLRDFNIGEVQSITRDPNTPTVAWALTHDVKLYRLANGHSTQISLPTDKEVRAVRTVTGHLYFLGQAQVMICRNCADGTAKELDLETIATGSFSDVEAGPDGALWLVGTPNVLLVRQWEDVWPTRLLVLSATLLSMALLPLVLRARVLSNRAMSVWFEDFPLNFSREDTRAAEKLLIAAYNTNPAALTIADDVGLDLAKLPQMALVAHLWRDILKSASNAGRLTHLLTEVMRDPDKAGVTWRLVELIGGQQKVVTALFARPSIAGLVLAPIEVVAPGKPPAPLSGQLEQVINAAAGFSDVPEFIRGLTAAQARTARVLVDGHPTGTGFLVGDSLLLTNWHVVENAEGPSIEAEFDFYKGGNEHGRKVKCATDWRVAYSPYADGDELAAEGTAARVWDYALLRLAEPVGAEGIGPDKKGERRGRYTIDGGAYGFKSEQPILIVGHPRTRPLQLSYAAPSNATATRFATRVRYKTNTEPGSSGSPVFDQGWRVVALHHAAGPTTTPGPFDVADGAFNQGIPMHKIVEHLRATITDSGVKSELAL